MQMLCGVLIHLYYKFSQIECQDFFQRTLNYFKVLVNYDAAKEMRKVRKEFYPLLFHMTRSDPRHMSTCICRSKVLLSYVKAR